MVWFMPIKNMKVYACQFDCNNGLETAIDLKGYVINGFGAKRFRE